MTATQNLSENLTPQQEDSVTDTGAAINIVTHTEDGTRTAKSQTSQFITTLGGLVGNVLEWYDFAVYGALSEDIGHAFFEGGCEHNELTAAMEGHTGTGSSNAAAAGSDNSINVLTNASNMGNSINSSNITGLINEANCKDDNLIESFAVFGGAFLMRPIGAALFGYIGDTYGRKKALEISVIMMCMATVVMGCLPTYKQAGIAAPILLCLVRLFQGISVGGELIGSIVYTSETAPPNRVGLYAGLSLMTAVLGTTMGMGVGALMHAVFTDDQLRDWAWRIPFLSGVILGVVAIWIRRKLHESEQFIALKEAGGLSKSPLKDAVTIHKWQTLIVFAVVCLWASGFYLCHVWVRTFMGTLLDPPTKGADGIAAGALIFLCFAFPAMGLLSDIYKTRRKVMLCGGIAVVLLSIPLFAALVHANSSPGLSFLALCIFAIALSAWGSPMCAWMVEAFPVDARYSAVAIGYNAAHALLGGTILLVAQVLVEKQGKLAPAVLLCAIASISTAALYFSERVLGKENVSGFKTIADAASASSNGNSSSSSNSTNYAEELPMEDLSSVKDRE